MKRSNKRMLRAAAVAVLLCGVTVLAEGPEAALAMRTADEVMYPDSFSMTAAITTERPGREATSMELEVSHKAGKGSFMEILSPARSKGTRFLQTESALWMYSPRAGSRTPLRLSPRESFQGSVFSNNDVGDSSWSNDYEPSIAGSTTLEHPEYGKVEVWILAGKALRRDVPYGSIRIYLKKDDGVPLRVEYDAKSGLLLKTMELSDYATAAGRLRPRRMVMTAADGSGERSTVLVRSLRERGDLPDAMFNQSWLVR